MHFIQRALNQFALDQFALDQFALDQFALDQFALDQFALGRYKINALYDVGKSQERVFLAFLAMYNKGY